MKIVLYEFSQQSHQHRAMALMQSGLARHGIRADIRERDHPIESDIAIVWGERNRLMKIGYAKNILVMERGYFPDRMEWTGIGWNGLNGRADFGNRGKDHKRKRTIGLKAKPWNHEGDHVVLLGQVPNDMSHEHINLDQWYANTIIALKRRGHKVVFRAHPKGSMLPRGCEFDVHDSLHECLDAAKFAVTFNSNSSVDAVLHGVPVCVGDRGSMAWAVAGHDMSCDPDPVDRTQWLSELAWCQWQDIEIENGDAWSHLSGVRSPGG